MIGIFYHYLVKVGGNGRNIKQPHLLFYRFLVFFFMWILRIILSIPASDNRE